MTELQRIRKSRGLVAGYVAKKLEITQPLFSQYERGHRPFPAKHFEQLANLYGVPMETIAKAVRCDNAENDG